MPLAKSTLWKSPKCFLHGADYNPEQWPPSVWEEDIRLMKEARINVVSLGIFAWSHLELDDGQYDFAWMDTIIGMLEAAGIHVFLATPSGARPPWLAKKYPEVLRVNEIGQRHFYGGRHNHCLSSPVYRAKVAALNRQLAKRYGGRDSVRLWHVSNEYSGACYCDLCQNAFRRWLVSRYGDLESLNQAWWTSFWSHRFTDWNQIDPPSPIGETYLHGLSLDWKRFVTDQTIDFMEAEIAAIRTHDTTTPVTTNLMGAFQGLDYFKISRHLDIVSWDAYPEWHREEGTEATVACQTAFAHDLNRGLGNGRPFLLMESTPSAVNWQSVCRSKRPGMHALSSVQAVAHGSDSVQYFQWRASRGGFEKFHGAVLFHDKEQEGRIFHEVCAVGKLLEHLQPVADGRSPALTAIVYDWENRWAYEQSKGFNNEIKNYTATVESCYQACWERSLPTDIVNQDSSLEPYRLVIVPAAYMLREGFAARLESFVENGGTLIVTQGSGWVNESDLIFDDGQLGPLKKLLGITIEETFVHRAGEKVSVQFNDGKAPAESEKVSEVLAAKSADIVATYQNHYFAGKPAATCKHSGTGKAFYIGFNACTPLIGHILDDLCQQKTLASAWPSPLPEGVHATLRLDQEGEPVTFLMNFTHAAQLIPNPMGGTIDLITGNRSTSEINLPPLGFQVLSEV